jgi:hypothetical protein
MDASPLQKVVFIHRILKFVLDSKFDLHPRRLSNFARFASVDSVWKETVLDFSCPGAVIFPRGHQMPPVVVKFVLQFYSLRGLDLDATPHVSKLFHLQKLSLLYTDITDKDLPHLSGLTMLTELNLNSTLIADELSSLSSLTSLRVLYLGQTKVSDVGVQRFADELTSLQVLGLNFTKVTDAGMVHIAKIKSLLALNLSDNAQITDKGLQELLNLPLLNPWQIYLGGTGVSTLGKESFKRQLVENQQQSNTEKA